MSQIVFCTYIHWTLPNSETTKSGLIYKFESNRNHKLDMPLKIVRRAALLLNVDCQVPRYWAQKNIEKDIAEAKSNHLNSDYFEP